MCCYLGYKAKLELESDSSVESFFHTNVSKRKTIKALQKHRKKMSSRDSKFLREIKNRNRGNMFGKQVDLMEGDRLLGKSALPPIRITVTNPLPSPVAGNQQQLERINSMDDEDVKLLQVPKSESLQKIRKRKKLSRFKDAETEDQDESNEEQLDKERKLML